MADASSTSKTSDTRQETPDAESRPRLDRAASLRRLKAQVQAAADELVQLRALTQKQAQQIRELEQQAAVTPAKAARLFFDEDPAAVRAKVQDFIEAIDAYLEPSSAPSSE